LAEAKPRRRGTALEQAILDAAWDELSDVGYSRLTIEAVAARAATSKPVIYRRWGSRAELVLAAWASRSPVSQTLPDTGELRADLLFMFRRVARRTDSMMSEMIAGVMGEVFRHPEVAELMRQQLKTSPLFDAIRLIVRRGVERGELPPVELPDRVARIPIDLIRSEAMTWGIPIPEQTITELVDQIYLPLLHGLASESQAQ
jgi:AcrR family transcriptional regulator